MQKSFITIFILLALTILTSYLFGSCKKDSYSKNLHLLQQDIPVSFPLPAYTFQDNPLSKEGVELGRKLFYDGRLSIDNDHPCSSCHQQEGGFGTFEHDLSHGVNNSHTLRNATVLFNLAWNTSFHWDGEFTTLKNEAAQPITGTIEMGESFPGIINKIKNDPDYRTQFQIVFKNSDIKQENILKALAQFIGSLISADSKYDRYKKGIATFTAQEKNGYQLYKANCASCHPEPLFTDYSFRNIGLPANSFLNDYGRMRITGKKEDSLKFKVPTLRNVYISSNYMHDGRFNTLTQCINHYRNGIQQSGSLDPLLINGIALTSTQVGDLSVFLRSLTDTSFLKDARYAKPQ